MVFGFIMAKRYRLTKEKNSQIEKYLKIQRDGRADTLTEEEASELLALKEYLK